LPSKDTRPLRERILGDWERVCITEEPEQTSCLGKPDATLHRSFMAGDGFEARVVGDPPLEGHWTLHGSQLVLRITAGSLAYTERWEARVTKDELILWDASKSRGEVHVRPGTPFAPTKGHETTSVGVERDLGKVRYAVDIPKGYRLAQIRDNGHRWDPSRAPACAIEFASSRERG
jgi:hypothetical protein